MMLADVFVRELWRCAPTIDQLRAVGLDEVQARRFREKNRCLLRTSDDSADNEHPLQDLLKRYDSSSVEIGMLRLTSLKEFPEYSVIGKAEADLLVIEHRSGEIQVRDHHDPVRIIWRGAASEDAFLDALLSLACFLVRGAINEVPWDDQALNCSEAGRLASLAGGPTYEDFFKVLTGCDE